MEVWTLFAYRFHAHLHRRQRSVERFLVPGECGDHSTRRRRRVSLVDVFRARDALTNLSEEREKWNKPVVIDRSVKRLLDLVDALLGGPIRAWVGPR